MSNIRVRVKGFFHIDLVDPTYVHQKEDDRENILAEVERAMANLVLSQGNLPTLEVQGTVVKLTPEKFVPIEFDDGISKRLIFKGHNAELATTEQHSTPPR